MEDALGRGGRLYPYSTWFMPPSKPLPFPEFVALLALMMSMIAFSIDAMLPALPEIARELTPEAPNRAQLVVLSFVFGMGFGTLLTGPLSDSFGRKPIISAGILLYVAGAIAAHQATSLEGLLASRVLQGVGAAAPRIVTLAVVRDTYAGDAMARVMSLVMMLFVVMPAMAPAIGALIIEAYDWRAVFLSFVLLGAVGLLWLNLRQPETLPRERRRPFQAGALLAASREILSDRDVLIYTAILSLGSAQMFALISSAQPIFESYGRGATFPRWFAVMALMAGTSAWINATFVERLGMQRMARTAYKVQTGLSLVMAASYFSGVVPEALAFPVFFLWAVSVFLMAGLTFGNLTSLAMERMGHVAGTTASLTGGISLVGSVVLAVPIGLAFDGTPQALIVGVLGCSSLAWGLMMRAGRSRR